MVAPIDYTFGGTQSPFQALMQGAQMGAQFGQLQAQRQQAEAQAEIQRQALEAQRARQDAISALYANPNPTARDFVRVASLLPEKEAASLRAGFELLDKDRRTNTLLFGGQVMSALQSSQPEIGITLLRERATAERNAGRADQAQAFETYAKLAEIDPKAVFTQMGTLLSTLGKEGQDAVDALTKVGEERRKTELAPLELAIKTASAGKEGFEATKAGYDAGIRFLELQYAPQRLEDEVKKRAADLKLTEAQTGQAVAAAQQARAMAGKATAEGEAARRTATETAAGVVPPAQRPEAEAKLRKEYNDNTKGFSEVRSAFERVRASQDNAVGDLSLIFGYMKMLDPGSVVREGEFATAQNAAGVPERILNVYNRVLSGQRLSPSQRDAFKNQAGQLYNAAQKQEQVVRDGITRIGTAMGLNTQNIFYEAAVPAAPTAPGAGAPTGAGVTVTPQMPAGFRLLPPAGR